MIITKDVLALIAAIHHVVDRPGVLNAQRARHVSRILCPPASVNSEE
jgi:hypothetical protein